MDLSNITQNYFQHLNISIVTVIFTLGINKKRKNRK